MNYLHYCSTANHEEFVNIPRYEKTTMEIPDDVYRELAEQIRIEAEMSSVDHATMHVEAERGDLVYALELKAFFYYDRVVAPDAIYYDLNDVVPVWVECHSYDAGGDERPNDFEIPKLRELLKLKYL